MNENLSELTWLTLLAFDAVFSFNFCIDLILFKVAKYAIYLLKVCVCFVMDYTILNSQNIPRDTVTHKPAITGRLHCHPYMSDRTRSMRVRTLNQCWLNVGPALQMVDQH